jgi:hypothetical protein
MPRDVGSAIRECLEGTDATLLQNILMRMPDKVCAVGLAMLQVDQRRDLYALIAAPKAARIEEEIRLEARRTTSALVRARILRTFLSYFGRAARAPGTIWIRPKRRD